MLDISHLVNTEYVTAHNIHEEKPAKLFVHMRRCSNRLFES